MSDDGALLKNLAGGGIGATVLGVAIFFYRFFQKRGCRSKSGCISFEVSTPHEGSTKEEHFHIEIPPTRTPVPSVEPTVLNNPEVIPPKENVAS